MSRLPELEPEGLSSRQREIYDRILASRGNIAGPFRIWLHSPELADRAQHLGEFLRYQTALEPRLSELAILVTARHMDCQVEWSIHERFAREGGLGPEVIDAVRLRRNPVFENIDEAAVYTFSGALLDRGLVADDVFDTALAHLGEEGVVDLTGLVGYYVMVAMTLNAFRVPLPEGVEALLPDCPED
ncbi:MAG: carboxymuconolactone decarboxylase family protein [bacterium]|nr:carboxymuconolactone decarboxylase family protein [bacterium]